MKLPPEVDQRIRQRFSQLEDEGMSLHRSYAASPVLWSDDHFTAPFYKLRTNFISLIELISGGRNNHNELIKKVQKLEPSNIAELYGIISGLKGDYEEGMLDSLVEMVEANISADYLGQAESLLKEGQPGQYDHVPAAVLAGAVLEDTLRRLCQRQTPPIAINKRGGAPKTLNTLIDDLKKADIFNELKAKQLRAWADVRNAAAHGRFNDFNREDVETMLKGVTVFITDYL